MDLWTGRPGNFPVPALDLALYRIQEFLRQGGPLKGTLRVPARSNGSKVLFDDLRERLIPTLPAGQKLVGL